MMGVAGSDNMIKGKFRQYDRCGRFRQYDGGGRSSQYDWGGRCFDMMEVVGADDRRVCWQAHVT